MNDLLGTTISRRDALRGFGGLCALGVVGGLAACGSGGGTGDASTVTAWNYHPEDKSGYEALTAAFHEAHPEVAIETAYKPAAQYETILKTALIGDTAPQMMAVNSAEIRGDLGVRSGHLAPLDAEVPLDEISETLRPVIHFDGHTWAVPLQALRIGLYYQKPVFEQYGLEPPRTWDDLTAIARTLKQHGVPAVVQPAQDMILPFFFYELAVSSILGPDGFAKLRSGEVKLTDPELMPAAELLVDFAPYYNDGFQATGYTESKALFAQGRGAMTVGGTTDYVGYRDANPDLEVGFIGFPTPDGSPAVDLAGFSFGFTLNKQAASSTAARTYARWLTTEEAQKIVLEKIGLPTRKGLEPTGSDPRSQVLREALAVKETPFFLDYPETAATYGTALKSGSGVFTGKLSPRQFAELVQGAIVPSGA